MTAPLDVFGWQADETGCGFYRVALPMQGLAGLGYRTAASMRLPHAIVGPDTVIVGQRVCKPAPTEMWQHLAEQGRKLVYEIDDDLWNIDGTSQVAHQFFAEPQILRNVEKNIRVAAAVTVTTEPLAERVSAWNDNVHIAPNAVPDWLVEHEPARRDDGTITIGWGGSATHEMDFEQAADQLRRFLVRNPGCELHCIGVDYASWMRVPRAQARFTPWVPNVEDFLRAIDYSIGVAPLRPHLFNSAKSSLKAQEVGALGIPVVASAVRPYEDYVQHGTTGFLVKRDHEWAKHLRALVNDPDMRAEMGAVARQQARAHTITATAPLWQKAILG